MPIGPAIAESFERSFALYVDLVAGIDESHLASKLPGLPSNTLGQQLWCVVGARESYARAIRAGEWSGFTCSLETTTLREPVADALKRSAATVTEVLATIDDFTAAQNRLVLDLLEHEAAHHGQLIRYIYALHLPIPPNWAAKYALKEV